MSYYGYPTDPTKRENLRLKAELEQMRYEQERRQQQEEEDRQARRREREEMRRQEMCEARDWSDAFQKGLPRARHEAAHEAADNAAIDAGTPGWEGATRSTFFADWVREIERAQALHAEVMAEAEEEIRRIRETALGKVADRLAAEFGETETAQALREDNPEYLVNW